MGKFLSIVIPRYKETETDIMPLLASIYTQVGVDFSDIETLVSNDGGSTPLCEKFLSTFGKLNITQLNADVNAGPGVTRQRGLDKAKGQYVMFCDADDVLHDVGALGALMQEADANVPDIISSSWLEELYDGEKYGYIMHSKETTWMHGKLFRRAFLIKSGIRHHPSLRVHEDSYFLSVATAVCIKSSYVDAVTYVWKYHEDSITRRNNADYSYSSIPTFIYACCEAMGQVERLNPGLMEYKVTQLLIYNFFQLHKPDWLTDEHKDHLAASEQALKEYLAPYMHYYRDAPAEKTAAIYNEERAKYFGGLIEPETFEAWVKRLGLEA